MNKWTDLALSIIILSIGLLLLSSCHKKDRYPLPQVPTPKQFYSMQNDYSAQNNLPYDAWWTQFHDPTLNHFIKMGLEKNLDMKVAMGNLEHAKGQLKQVKLNWLPLAQLFGGYSTNPAFGVPGSFYGIWAFYAINIAQQIKQQEVATFNVHYHQAMVDGVRLTVIGQIASAYFTLIGQEEQLRLLIQFDNDYKQLIRFCQKDIGFGLRNDIDLAQFLIKEQVIQAQINTTEHNIVLSQNALHYLIDENPGEVKTKHRFNQIDFTRFKPGSLPASVLQNRPDIRMAAYAVKRAGAEVSVAYSQFFPLLQLDQFAGEATGEATRSGLTIAQMSDSYVNWTLTPSTLGAISAAKGTHQAELSNYIKTVQNSLKEVDNDFSANKRFTDYFLHTKAAENDYRTKYLLQQGLLKAGLISYNNLIESKVNYDDMALLTNQARLQLAMTLVLLYQDLAGGYKVGYADSHKTKLG